MSTRITLSILALAMLFGIANAQRPWSPEHVVNWKFRVPKEQLPELLRQADEARNVTESASVSKRIGDEIVVSADALPESEVHAAVNPLDANNIVASAMRLNYNNPLQVLLCPIHFTRDGGATWRKSSFLNLPSRPGSFVAGGGDPVLVFDADGILYFS